MSILDKLPDSQLGLGGQKPITLKGSLPNSKTHVNFLGQTINDRTELRRRAGQSKLDLDGTIPSNNYKDNAPEGSRF